MTLQVLVSTMNQQDFSILEKMNIVGDALIGNQCGRNSVEQFSSSEQNVVMYSFNEKGVGLNRNNTLMRASADIVLFADDDVVYVDNYCDIILNEYKKNPKADLIIFNMIETRFGGEPHEIIKKNRFVGKYGVSSFGTYCVSCRLESIRKNNIFFHLQFGGGAKYSHGEDSIFLKDCADKKLKIYTSKTVIAKVTHKESTWFKGHNDKYFYDTGVLYHMLYKPLTIPFCFVHILRHKKMYKDFGLAKAIKLMLRGARDCKKRCV